jgi:exodeoxyribonuclease-3
MPPTNLYSWNINGIKAITRKGELANLIEHHNPDVVCLQETKSTDQEVSNYLEQFASYYHYSNSAAQKGYAGTAVLTKEQPQNVRYDIGHQEFDQEGRVIALDYGDYYLVNVYVPNAGNGLKRLDYREEWDKVFTGYLAGLQQEKPVIVTGDFNVAHEEIDIARPKQNYNKSAGFTQTEIDGFDHMLSKGFVDTFRKLYPDKVVYSYWSYRAQARKRNVGWRIDYFLVSESLFDKVKDAYMLNEVYGSDHCPVVLALKG